MAKELTPGLHFAFLVISVGCPGMRKQALRAHNPKVVGSNPGPATNEVGHLANGLGAFLFARLRVVDMRWHERRQRFAGRSPIWPLVLATGSL